LNISSWARAEKKYHQLTNKDVEVKQSHKRHILQIRREAPIKGIVNKYMSGRPGRNKDCHLPHFTMKI